MLIRAVIFDMDGLMLDTEPIYRIVWKRAVAECGYILTDDAYRGLVGRGRKTAEQVLSQMAGPDFPLETFRNLSRDAEVHAFSVEPVSKKPGLDKLLSLVESRNLPKAVATSTERAIAVPLLARMGPLDRFAAVATGDEVARGKPHPDLFLLAAQRLETSPSLCLVLEDSEAGATAAVSAGMRMYLVPDLVEPSADVKRSVQGIFGSLTDVARNFELASASKKSAGLDVASFRTNRFVAFPLDERDR
jgi:HAD superfamily hydrolase (TIGR01509 family)